MEKALEIRTEERRPIDDEFVETTEGPKSTPWAKVQHKHNPLHVYIKLIRRGVPKKRARNIVIWYEKNVWNYLDVGVTPQSRFYSLGNICRAG